MNLIATAMNRLCDLLVAPFGGSAAWAVTVLSALAGVGLLALFKVTTPQTRLRDVRARLFGHVYELGLFQESLVVMLRIQRDLAAANLRSLVLTLPALAAMIVPLALVLPQFEARFAHRPLRPGEAVVVTATLAPGHAALLDGLRLTGGDGVAVETLPVRDRQAATAQWRVRVRTPGRHDLTVHADGDLSWTKRLEAGGGLPALATRRERGGPRAWLLSPAEPPLPRDAALASLALDLPTRETRYAGARLSWLAAFCLFSLAAGLAARPLLRVEI